MTLQHPSDRGGDRPGRFARFAEYTSNFTSSPAFFGACMVLVGIVIGAHFAELEVTWLLLAGESMTAVTLLLLALLKNSERRAEHAIQLKLDAIAAALLETQEGKPGTATHSLREAKKIEDEA